MTKQTHRDQGHLRICVILACGGWPFWWVHTVQGAPEHLTESFSGREGERERACHSGFPCQVLFAPVTP